MAADVILLHGDLVQFLDDSRCLECSHRDRKCILQQGDSRCVSCEGSDTRCLFSRIVTQPKADFQWDQLLRTVDVDISKKSNIPPELWARLRKGISELSVQLSQDLGDGARTERDAPKERDQESVIASRLHEYVSKLSSEESNPGLHSPPPSTLLTQPSRTDSATPVPSKTLENSTARSLVADPSFRDGLDPESRERIADEVTPSLAERSRQLDIERSNSNIIGWLDAAENRDPNSDLTVRAPSEHLAESRSESPDPRTLRNGPVENGTLAPPWIDERKGPPNEVTFPWTDPIRPHSITERAQPDTSNAAMMRFQRASQDNETLSQVASDGGETRNTLSAQIAQSVLSWWSSHRNHDSTVLSRHIQDLIAKYEYEQIQTEKIPDIRSNISRPINTIVSPPISSYSAMQQSPVSRSRGTYHTPVGSDDGPRRLYEHPMRSMSAYSENSDLKHKARSTDSGRGYPPQYPLLPRPTPGTEKDVNSQPDRPPSSRESTWSLPRIEGPSSWSPSQNIIRSSAPDSRYREIHSIQRPRNSEDSLRSLYPRSKERAEESPSLIKAVNNAPRLELAPGVRSVHIEPPPVPTSQDSNPPSNDDSQMWEARHSDQTSRSLICPHPDCKDVMFRAKNPSDLKKHMQHHLKPFKCTVQGCTRSEGFSTKNDLERHQKSIHKLAVRSSFDRSFKCQGRNCHKSDKIWPRLDNFKSHCSRMHPDEDVNDLVKRSEVTDHQARRAMNELNAQRSAAYTPNKPPEPAQEGSGEERSKSPDEKEEEEEEEAAAAAAAESEAVPAS